MTKRFMRLRRWMFNRDINQAKLAELLGCSKPHISRVLGKGDQDFNLDQIYKLALLTDIPAEYFVTGETQKLIKDYGDRLRSGVENAR